MDGRIACFLIIPLLIRGCIGSNGKNQSRLRVSDCKGLSADRATTLRKGSAISSVPGTMRFRGLPGLTKCTNM